MRIEFGEGRLSDKAKENLKELLEKEFYPTALAWEKAEEFGKRWGELFGYKENVAVASGTSIIVTYNAKDFKGIASFGVRSITPKELMEEIL